MAVADLLTLRTHVLDDARDLAGLLGLVAPLLKGEASDQFATGPKLPATMLLCAQLVRAVTLTLCRIHEPGPRQGRTGYTASLPSLLSLAGKLYPAQGFDAFRNRRNQLEQRFGTPAFFKVPHADFREVREYRHAELAHSLQRTVEPKGAILYPAIADMARETLVLFAEVDAVLCSLAELAGLSSFAASEVDGWEEAGKLFWS